MHVRIIDGRSDGGWMLGEAAFMASPYIIFGDPESSPMYLSLTGSGGLGQMPKSSPELSDAKKNYIFDFIMAN